jgi:tetratricopeptide (TPR) repeat protein
VWLALVAVAAGAEPTGSEKARRWFLSGRYEEAAAAYVELAQREPVSSVLGLARARSATGKSAEAEKTLREFLVGTPQAAAVAADLALLLLERGQLDEAETFASQALRLHEPQVTARWVAAELHRLAGRLDEALRAYAWLIDHHNAREQLTSEELRLVGLAVAEHARWKRNSGQFRFLVNTFYPGLLKEEPGYWPAHLEAAWLFLEKYNEPDAKAELEAALALNPNAAEVHVARACLALQNFHLAEAKSALVRALEINPRLVAALRCQAAVWLIDLRPQEAASVLEAARELNPVDEATLGRLAAAYGALDGVPRMPDGSRLGRLIHEVTTRNPHCGRFYQALAEGFDLQRRYPAAAEFYREADRRMPQLLYARGQLGLMYMRLGREAEAKTLLDAAFEADPFNVRVKNMLEVLDVLRGYAVLETPHFVLKFDQGRDALLAKYAARYLEDEVYPRVVQQLGYAPPQKSLIEIFSRARNTSGHGWFSARMVGLPSIGTVAACAGQMVAMVSPGDMPQKFNWARVLRHEFVHIVNLQQTAFAIPHWYTEALAVLQEGGPRPASWDAILARRARAGTLLNLDTINYGFIRPKNREDWTLAYCQSRLYAEFMRERYGADALSRLLAAYTDNQPTGAAVRRCFGVDLAEFETAYRAYVEALVQDLKLADAAGPELSFAELHRAVEKEPQDVDLLARLAEEYLRRRDQPAARKHALAARQLDPRHARAAYVLARVHLAIGDQEHAQEILQQSFDEQRPQADHLALLAELRFGTGELAAAERLYRLGLEVCPPADRWLKALTRLYLKSGEQRKLSECLQRLAETDDDNVLFSKKLLELAVAQQDWPAAVRWARHTLQIDIRDAEVHAQLAEALDKQGAPRESLEEFATAIQLEPDRSEWRLALADMHAQQGQKSMAVLVLQELLQREPDHAAAQDRLQRWKNVPR